MNKLTAPEINISIYGVLLNFVWEIWQAPLFEGMDDLTHFEVTLHCTFAALGDVVILLVAFWSIALSAKSRRWIFHPKPMQVAGFLAVGIIITVVFEALAIYVLNRWQYAAAMPVLPVMGIGVVPIFQWLIIPPIIVLMLRQGARDG